MSGAAHQPRILVLGAGALGRLWAGRMPAGSCAFVPRGRDRSPVTIRYTLRESDHHHYPVSVPEIWPSRSMAVDAVLVTTKAPDTLAAVSGIEASLAPGIPLVLFQNGMGSQLAVAEAFPRRPVLAAVTTEGANRPSANILVHAGSGQTWIGALNDPARALAATVVGWLQASRLGVTPEPDIESRLWHKLVINAGINPFTALLDCTNGDILASPLYQDHIDDLCREMAAVLGARGMPAEASGLRQRVEQVARATASNSSSMRSDVVQGRATEIDFINGYLVRCGQQWNIPVPVNQWLTEQVHMLSDTSH